VLSAASVNCLGAADLRVSSERSGLLLEEREIAVINTIRKYHGLTSEPDEIRPITQIVY
jgi:hypothetical protein